MRVCGGGPGLVDVASSRHLRKPFQEWALQFLSLRNEGLVLMVVDEMCSFFPAAQLQTSGFDGLRGIPSRGCALQLDIVEEMAGGRQEARNREDGRRKDGTTHDPRTPRKGRLRPVKLQFPPAAHSGLPKRHLCRGHFYSQNLLSWFCACVSKLCLLK